MEQFLLKPESWILVSFIIFAVMMWFLGRKAIVGSLDAKIAAVRAEIDTAQNLRLEAQRLFEDYERRHMEAVRDAEHVVKTAEHNARENRKQAEADLKETLAQREKNLEDRIARMKQSAIEEIRAYAADLAIQATAGIIMEKLDKDARNQLIEQAIKNVAKQAA